MQKLTDRQELFCYEYLLDFNATQAALRAGYSSVSASALGSRNLKNETICQRLAVLIEERKARLSASADYILQRLIEIDKLDISEIVDDEGNVLPIKDWSEIWRKSISAIDISEVKTANALIKKIKLPDKLKNLELLGKHINVSAFKEQVRVSGKESRELVINVNNTKTRENILQLEQTMHKSS